MLFPEEDAPHLKQWIVKRLENTSDADPDVLADYVLALLRHDGDISDVRKLCEEEIPDFLKEDSPIFVSDVFDAIAYRSYLPGAPPPPPKHARFPAPPPAQAPALGGAPSQPPTNLYYDDVPMGSAPMYMPQPQNGSRKRGYNDWDDPNAQNGGDGGFGGGRPFKQARRGGRGGRQDDASNFRGGAPPFLPYPLPPFSHQPPPNGPPGPSAVGYIDPKGAMHAMYGMSLAAGHSMPGFMAHDRGQLPPKKRKKCRDWEKKGYCQRGSSCMFQHGNDPVYPPMPGPPFGGVQPLPPPGAVEEYDPTNALMPDLFNGTMPPQSQPYPPHFGQQMRPRGGKHQGRQKRGGDKAPFSADGPVSDKTKSTIVVENIPEESFTEEQVKEFFSQFGSVEEVTMKPYKRLAIVKFDSWNAANAAYQSPKVIFDNRFVKVFWYKDDVSETPGSASRGKGTHGAKKAYAANGASEADVNGNGVGPQPEIDMEEFAKQQEEKQKAFEEKTRKREELERQREELEQRQKELIAKQMEEKAKLEARLASSNGTKSEDGGDSKKPTSQSEALRAQLAALEAEARQMGLDPDAIEAPAPWPARGGYGRGRGGWRGPSPSPYTPRGRGSYRGRANVHAAYAAYSLDNRPKKVVISGVDFTASEKDETLRQYLFGIGEFTDIQTTSESTEISFKDRKTAEKFFNSVILNNKEIPGLHGSPVELSWGGNNGAPGSVLTTPGGHKTSHTSTSGTTTTPATHSTRTGTETNGKTNNETNPTRTDKTATTDGHEEEGAISSSDKDVHITLERPPTTTDQNEMDYEVADEEQWGY